MDFKTLTILPFRRILIEGVEKFISDLGNIRLQIADPSVLVTKPVKVEDPYTDAFLQYQLGLELPATLEIQELSPTLIQLNFNPNAILMVAQPILRTADRSGLITEIIPYPDAAVHNEYIFNTYSKPLLKKPNPVQGVLTCDVFSGMIPSTYVNIIKGLETGGTSDVETTFELRFGVKVPHNPSDSFVADSEVEMLLLEPKKGDRCYRTDLESSFINITGNNDAITDWQPLAADNSDLLRAEFDFKLSEQEDRLVAMIAALGE